MSVLDDILEKARENAEKDHADTVKAMAECEKETGSTDEYMEYLDLYPSVDRNIEYDNNVKEIADKEGYDFKTLARYSELCKDIAGHEAGSDMFEEIHGHDDDIMDEHRNALHGMFEELEEIEEELEEQVA